MITRTSSQRDFSKLSEFGGQWEVVTSDISFNSLEQLINLNLHSNLNLLNLQQDQLKFALSHSII